MFIIIFKMSIVNPFFTFQRHVTVTVLMLMSNPHVHLYLDAPDLVVEVYLMSTNCALILYIHTRKD